MKVIPLSLPNNYINHIVEDSLGTIWVATSKRWFYITTIIIISRLLDTIVFILPSEGGILFGGEISFSAIIKKPDHGQHLYLPEENLDISNTGYKKMVQLKKIKY